VNGQSGGCAAAYAGLSCYTANLARYLDGEWDGRALLARSVRLAVRVDLPDRRPAFSHHGIPLDRLPDGGRLRLAGAARAAEALAGVADELRRHGRALVVADLSELPWSPAFRRGGPAPHWLLVDDRRGERWHVVDEFCGLLPAGPQRPYAGWLPTAQLRRATAPRRWTPEQRRRNGLAFGFPVPVPEVGQRQWLRRERGGASRAALPGRWLVGDALALPWLADRIAGGPAGAVSYLDDCWAAAGHRVFAHRWRLARTDPAPGQRRRIEDAAAAWDGLPRLLRLAVESAALGRPRPALTRRAFAELASAEQALTAAASPMDVQLAGSTPCAG
jgi:hypothetical protein